jgi:hypothetical protein
MSMLPAGLFTLAWPASYSDYTLEYASSMPVETWTQITNRVGTIGERHAVTLRSQDGYRAFRLRKVE